LVLEVEEVEHHLEAEEALHGLVEQATCVLVGQVFHGLTLKEEEVSVEGCRMPRLECPDSFQTF